jgi:hypothetical protein
VLNFVPIVGLLFAFTNTVGAALWAAQLEATQNVLDGPASAPPKPAAPAAGAGSGGDEL